MMDNVPDSHNNIDRINSVDFDGVIAESSNYKPNKKEPNYNNNGNLLPGENIIIKNTADIDYWYIPDSMGICIKSKGAKYLNNYVRSCLINDRSTRLQYEDIDIYAITVPDKFTVIKKLNPTTLTNGHLTKVILRYNQFI